MTPMKTSEQRAMRLVEVVRTDTGKVVKRLGPMSERKADRVEDGMALNLDHEHYFTRIVAAIGAVKS